MGVTRSQLLRFIGGGFALSAAGCASLAVTVGAPHPQVTAPVDVRLLTPEQMREDLDLLVRVLFEVSVDPFQMTPRHQFEAHLRETRDALKAPMDTRAFYLRVAPLFASLNDGHLSIDIDEIYGAYRDKGGRAFPFNLRFAEDDAIYAAVDLAPEVPKNSQIVSVDGVDGSELARRMFSVVSAQNLALRRRRAPDSVRQYFFAQYGDKPAYETAFVPPGGGAASTRRVNATDVHTLRSRLPKNVGNGEPYTFSRIAQNRIGYVDYRSCQDLDRFKRFCKKTFASIKQQPVRGVIVDIRQNGGGDSSLNEVLWSYLTSKPLDVGGGFSVRANSRLRHEYGWVKYAQRYFPLALVAPDEKVVTYDFSWYKPAPGKHNLLRFDGPCYLLVSTQTFSSALDCAQVAKDSGIATLVGEETAEPVNSNGEVYRFHAQHSGIRANFPTKYYFSKGYADGQGVIPDVPVTPSEADIAAGRDPALQYAIDSILGSRA